MLLSRFKEFIQQHHLFQPKDHLLLAVSGGVDSVVLCELCKQAGYNFSIAHCNFNLRGAESSGDAEFVTKLSNKYNTPFYLKEFNTAEGAEKNKVSIQVEARNLRYQWFQEILATLEQPAWLLTAHHLDDNIETLLMNFFKGTGIAGLRGILPKQN
ncbi:MAG TPA: tRNA lysidine(34) synthetase TilS, partial [Chitinophagaceae bacterium]|nr:tRNA lysidine(34) synthetase TilS [Chitinophagaceae bacterium]